MLEQKATSPFGNRAQTAVVTVASAAPNILPIISQPTKPPVISEQNSRARTRHVEKPVLAVAVASTDTESCGLFCSRPSSWPCLLAPTPTGECSFTIPGIPQAVVGHVGRSRSRQSRTHTRSSLVVFTRCVTYPRGIRMDMGHREVNCN